MIRTLSPCLAIVLVTTIAAAEPAAPMATPVAPAASAEHTEGGAFRPFYGEILHEKRYYLFGTKAQFAKFKATKELNPQASKMFIGKGPNRSTVVIETDKDAAVMTDRLMQQFRDRYKLGN